MTTRKLLTLIHLCDLWKNADADVKESMVQRLRRHLGEDVPDIKTKIKKERAQSMGSLENRARKAMDEESYKKASDLAFQIIEVLKEENRELSRRIILNYNM